VKAAHKENYVRLQLSLKDMDAKQGWRQLLLVAA
jgi:hypothetical protein